MKIMPLEGKYYGTMIEVESGPLKGASISLWKCTGNPSDRQLANWGLTRSQWDSNAPIEDGWGGRVGARDSDLMCDGHYESQEVYELALKIAEVTP